MSALTQRRFAVIAGGTIGVAFALGILTAITGTFYWIIAVVAAIAAVVLRPWRR